MLNGNENYFFFFLIKFSSSKFFLKIFYFNKKKTTTFYNNFKYLATWSSSEFMFNSYIPGNGKNKEIIFRIFVTVDYSLIFSKNKKKILKIFHKKKVPENSRKCISKEADNAAINFAACVNSKIFCFLKIHHHRKIFVFTWKFL